MSVVLLSVWRSGTSEMSVYVVRWCCRCGGMELTRCVDEVVALGVVEEVDE